MKAALERVRAVLPGDASSSGVNGGKGKFARLRQPLSNLQLNTGGVATPPSALPQAAPAAADFVPWPSPAPQRPAASSEVLLSTPAAAPRWAEDAQEDSGVEVAYPLPSSPEVEAPEDDACTEERVCLRTALVSREAALCDALAAAAAAQAEAAALKGRAVAAEAAAEESLAACAKLEARAARAAAAAAAELAAATRDAAAREAQLSDDAAAAAMRAHTAETEVAALKQQLAAAQAAVHATEAAARDDADRLSAELDAALRDAAAAREQLAAEQAASHAAAVQATLDIASARADTEATRRELAAAAVQIAELQAATASAAGAVEAQVEALRADAAAAAEVQEQLASLRADVVAACDAASTFEAGMLVAREIAAAAEAEVVALRTELESKMSAGDSQLQLTSAVLADAAAACEAMTGAHAAAKAASEECDASRARISELLAEVAELHTAASTASRWLDETLTAVAEAREAASASEAARADAAAAAAELAAELDETWKTHEARTAELAAELEETRKAHEARTAADNAELESRERLLVLLCADNEALRNALRDAAESSAAARHGVDAAHAAVAAAVASVRTGASLADQPPAGEQQHIERARKYKALARELHVRLRTVTQAHAAELAAMRAKLREAYHAVGTPSSTPLHS